jgi:hypothetical protein
VTLDVETVASVAGRSRFEQALAVLLGSAAVIAAVLASVQFETGQAEQRALLSASRLSVRVFELSAATGAITSFGGQMLRETSATSAGGIARQLVAFDQPGVADVQNALAAAEAAAAERLTNLIEPMAAPSPLPSGLDPHTAGLVELGTGDVRTILTALANPSAPIQFHVAAEGNRLTNALNAQVDRAEGVGGRGTISLLGLALLALAGVLLGLASTLPRGRGAYLALATGGGGVILAAALAAASVA